VAVNFAEDGEFLSYTTKWCRGYDNEDGSPRDSGCPAGPGVDRDNENACLGSGISFAVVADIGDQCVEYAQVYNEGAGATLGTTNKAWTNRVWNNSEKNPNHPRFPFYSYLTTNENSRPYGSLPLSGELVDNLSDTTNLETLYRFVFTDRDEHGIPYTCLHENSVGPINSANLYGGSAGIDGPDCTFDTGSNYRDDGLVDNALSVASILSAFEGIQKLFAWVFIRAELNTASSYIDTTGGDDALDVSGDLRYYGIVGAYSAARLEYLSPPRVFSLNPIFCSTDGSSTGVPCASGDADNVTITGKNGGYIGVDYDNDGFVSSLELEAVSDHVAYGTFNANLQFFGFADDNRMPLRKVSVNWDDGDIQNENTYGYYRNSKPFCDEDAEPVPGGLPQMNELCLRTYEDDGVFYPIPSGITCVNDTDCPANLTDTGERTCLDARPIAGDFNDLYDTFEDEDGDDFVNYDRPRFGNSDRACENIPFEFEHYYTCNPSDADTRVSTLHPNTQEELFSFNTSGGEPVTGNTMVCVFKPRVQLIDNWGYCNGDCPGGLGGEFCYAQDPTSPAGTECAWDSAHEPWTEYRGNIVIVP
jgi:hypothetical protein